MRASRENRFLMMTNPPNVTFLARTFICIVAGLNLLAIYAFLGNIFARGSIELWGKKRRNNIFASIISNHRNDAVG